jgi:non-ribosomal peptide synthetase component F
VGDGYLNLPELSSSKFVGVSDDFWQPLINGISTVIGSGGDDELPAVSMRESLPGATAGRGVPWPRRVYRTGDRARITDSGELHLLGRIDDQVRR